MAHYDLILSGGAAVFPWGVETVDIGVRDGRIAAIGLAPGATAESRIDCTGLHVLPGLIDAHVHLRDPGDASVESIPAGTRAAILGGIACVFDMPNTSPAITDTAALTWKQEYAGGNSWCDIGLYVGGTKHNIASLAELETGHAVCAIKIFAGSSTGDLLVEDDESLLAIMQNGRRRIAYHSEDEYRLRERRAMFHGGEPYSSHAEWRDVEAAFLGTRRLLALARQSGRPAHILHVTTAEELAYIPAFRELVTCELLVNHLTQIGTEAYETLGGMAVINPPLRDRRHWEASWAAVRDGTVDVISSDHAPHPLAAKLRPWPDCASGVTGVQTLVPIMLDHVAAGRLSISRLVDLMCAGPARVYGAVNKGRLAVGYDADFTLADLGHKRTIETDWIASPCGWTPFAGMQVTGWPRATIVRGQVVMREDEVLGSPAGRLVSFR